VSLQIGTPTNFDRLYPKCPPRQIAIVSAQRKATEQETAGGKGVKLKAPAVTPTYSSLRMYRNEGISCQR